MPQEPRNPFTPPVAPVRDAKIEGPRKDHRPRLVDVGMFLFGLGQIVFLAGDAILALATFDPIPVRIQLAWLFLAGASAWLIYRLWCRKNWARFFVLVMSIAMFPRSLPSVPWMPELAPVLQGLSVAQAVSFLLACVVLFLSPARLWFRQEPRQQ